MPSSTRRWLALVLVGVTAGCNHPLEIRNSSQYELEPTYATPQRIAVLPYHGESESRVAFQSVVRGLANHPAVDQVRTDWSSDRRFGDFRPDAIVEIQPWVTPAGSWWSYLVTSPGFLAFAPAWHGFVYEVDIVTDYKIFPPSGGRPIREGAVDTSYDLRHCDFWRAFFAESGWWVPGWGISSALAGFYMVTYDDDITAQFHKDVEENYGRYVAESIVRQLTAPDGPENVLSRGTPSP